MYLPTAAHIIRRGLLIAGMTALASLAGPLARAPHFAASAAPREASEAGFDHTHSAWTRVLAAHVRDGWVDYAGLHRRPEALDAYLASLAAPRPEEFRSLNFYLHFPGHVALKKVPPAKYDETRIAVALETQMTGASPLLEKLVSSCGGLLP